MAAPSWIYIAFLVSLGLGGSCSGRALLPMFEEFRDQLAGPGARNTSSLEQFDNNNITKAHFETLFEEPFSRLSDCPAPDIHVPRPCHDDDPVFPPPDYHVPCHDHENCPEPPPCQSCLPPQPSVLPPCDDDDSCYVPPQPDVPPPCDDDDSCYEPPYHQPCLPPQPYEPPLPQPCLPPQPYEPPLPQPCLPPQPCDPTPCSDDDNCYGPPLDPCFPPPGPGYDCPHPVGHIVPHRPTSLGVHGIDENGSV